MISSSPCLSEGDSVSLSGVNTYLGEIISILPKVYVVRLHNGIQETHPFDAVEIYAPLLEIGDIVKHHQRSPAFERLQQEGFGEPLWEVVEVTPNWVRVIPVTKLPFTRTFDTRPTRRYTWEASCFEIIKKAS